MTLVLLAVLTELTVEEADAQGIKRPALWNAFVSVGYAYAAPDIVTDFYDLILHSYRNAGVPVSTGTPFGSALGVEGGIRVSSLETISVGVAAGYWYAPAYSSYRDYGGTLRVNGTSSAFEMALVVRARLAHVGGFPINITVQPGLVRSKFTITEDLQFVDLPAENYHAQWTGSAWGPCFQMTIGSSIAFGDWLVSLDGGYAFAWSNTHDISMVSTEGDRSRHDPWNIGQTGPLVLATIDLRL
jgi:hypothetical protein